MHFNFSNIPKTKTTRLLSSKDLRFFVVIVIVIIYLINNLVFIHRITDVSWKDLNTPETSLQNITVTAPRFHGIGKCHRKENTAHGMSNNAVYSGKNISDISHPLLGSSPKPRCALLFFGLPRLFRPIVLPSIEKYILAANPNCDVFLHTYNVTSISTVRSGEENSPILPNDTYLLTNNTFIESMDSFHSQRNLSEFRPYHEKGWGECCENVDNIVKQWHSIEGVWKLMESYGKKLVIKGLRNNKLGHYYDRVGLFRSDVVYLNPINISNGDAVVPRFLWPGAENLQHIFVNDRMFYGKYDYAKIWATERFSFAKQYLKIPNTIHGETFLRVLMSEKNVPLDMRDDICFLRARANSEIQEEVCSVECIEEDIFELLTKLKRNN